MLKISKTKRPRQHLNPRCVKLVCKCTFSHNGELGLFTERTSYLALSLHENKDKYDQQHTRMEESINAYRITGRKALGKQWKTEQWHIPELKGYTKMHQEELGSDPAICVTHDRVV